MQQNRDQQIREIIARAINDGGRGTQAELERYIGVPAGYLSGYLSKKRSPRSLKYEYRMKISKMLDIEPELLDVGEETSTEVPQNDGAIYVPEPGDALTPQPHVVYIKVASRSLDDHSEWIEPGNIVAFDNRASEIKKMKTGRIVYAERYQEGRADVLVRQYVAPDKLVTNSSAGNEVVRIDDDVTVLGIFLYVFRGATDS